MTGFQTGYPAGRRYHNSVAWPEGSSPVTPTFAASVSFLGSPSRSGSDGSRTTGPSDASQRSPPRHQRLPRTRVFYASRGRQVIGIFGHDGQVREKVEQFERMTDWKVRYDGSQLPSALDDDDMEDDLEADYEKVGGTFYTGPSSRTTKLAKAPSKPSEELDVELSEGKRLAGEVPLNDEELSLLNDQDLQFVTIGSKSNTETFLLNQTQELDHDRAYDYDVQVERQKRQNNERNVTPSADKSCSPALDRPEAKTDSHRFGNHGDDISEPPSPLKARRGTRVRVQKATGTQSPSQGRRAISSMGHHQVPEPEQDILHYPRQVSALSPAEVDLVYPQEVDTKDPPATNSSNDGVRSQLRTPHLVTTSNTIHRGIRGVPPQMCGTRPAESAALRKPMEDLMEEDWTAQLQKTALRESGQMPKQVGTSRDKSAPQMPQPEVVVPKEGRLGLIGRFRLRRNKNRRTLPGPQPRQFGAAQAISPIT